LSLEGSLLERTLSNTRSTVIDIMQVNYECIKKEFSAKDPEDLYNNGNRLFGNIFSRLEAYNKSINTVDPVLLEVYNINHSLREELINLFTNRDKKPASEFKKEVINTIKEYKARQDELKNGLKSVYIQSDAGSEEHIIYTQKKGFIPKNLYNTGLELNAVKSSQF